MGAGARRTVLLLAITAGAVAPVSAQHGPDAPDRALRVSVRGPIDIPLPGRLRITSQHGLPAGIDVEPAIDADLEQGGPGTLRLVLRRPLTPRQRYRITLTGEFLSTIGSAPETTQIEAVAAFDVLAYRGMGAPGSSILVTLGPWWPADTLSSRFPPGVSLEPAVTGQVSVRDGVLRFDPAEPWRPGHSYYFRIDSSYRAHDGTPLRAPFELRWTGPEPQLRTVWLPTTGGGAEMLYPGGPIRLLFDGPVDPATILRRFRLDVDPTVVATPACRELANVKLQLLGVRPVEPGDVALNSLTGGIFWSSGDRPDQRFHRILTLQAPRDLPAGCPGWWTYSGPAPIIGGGFRTPGPLVIAPPGGRPWQTPGPAGTLAALDTAPPPFRLPPDGRLVLSFSEPVNEAELRRTLTLSPALAYDLRPVWPDLPPTSWHLTARFEPGARYELRIARGLRSVVGAELAAEVTWRFELARPGLRDGIELRATHRVIGRQDEMRVPLRVTSAANVEWCALEISDTLTASFLVSYWKTFLGNTALPAPVCVTTPVPPAGDGDTLVYLPIPRAALSWGQGLLAVFVQAPRARPSLDNLRGPPAVFQRSDLAAEVLTWPAEILVRARQRRAGAPLAGTLVEVVGCGRTVASGRSGADGVARLPFPGASGSPCVSGLALRIRHADDLLWQALPSLGDAEMRLNGWEDLSSEWVLGPQSEPGRAILHVDRGIYAPGEQLRAIVLALRQPLTSGPRPAAAEEARWELWGETRIWEGEPHPLRQGSVVLDRAGTGALTLPLDSLPPGSYRLVLSLRNGPGWLRLAGGDFTIGRYGTGGLIPSITAPGRWMLQDTVPVLVEAVTRQGHPAVGRAVRWRAIFVTHRALRHVGDELSYVLSVNTTPVPLDATLDSVVVAGVGRLGPAGRLTIRLPLPAPRGGRAINARVEATVVDTGGDTVTVGLTRELWPRQGVLALRRVDSATAPADTVELELRGLGGINGRTAGLHAVITTFRRTWFAESLLAGKGWSWHNGWGRVRVGQCAVVTDADGLARCRLPAGGTMSDVQAEVRETDGRAGTSLQAPMEYVPMPRSGLVAASEAALRQARVRLDTLAVVHDSAVLTVGDTLRVTFDNPFPRAHAWLTLSRLAPLDGSDHLVRQGRDTLAMVITPAMVPGVLVDLTLIEADGDSAGARVVYAWRPVAVRHSAGRLQVVGTRREDGQVVVEVRDAEGRPVRASLRGWRLDGRLLALADWVTVNPDVTLARPVGVTRGFGSTAGNAVPETFDDGGRLSLPDPHEMLSLVWPTERRLQAFPAEPGPVSATAADSAWTSEIGRATLALGSRGAFGRLIIVAADTLGRVGTFDSGRP